MTALINITQFINNQWIPIGTVACNSFEAVQKLDSLEKKLSQNSDKYIAVRQDKNGLLIINLDHGPVKMRVTY